MADLFVVGGRQKPISEIEHKREWHHYQAGVIARLNLESGAIEPSAEYVSPPDVCPDDDPSILFKTASLVADRLYVTTQTEVLGFDVPSFRRVLYLSVPAFNDLHHVLPEPDGSLVVANTGLDMVMRMSVQGDTLEEWAVLDEPLWSRFSREVDYRKVLTTKPHQSHPNHVFRIEDELWVTRPVQRDARCLTCARPAIPLGVECISHDGLVHGGRVYFTAVDGHVVIVDAARRTVLERVDLKAIGGHRTPLGWCRGLELVGDGLLAVGFSRLRPTAWKENVRWLKHQLGGAGQGLLPTRVAVYDLKRRTLEAEYSTESVGLNAIFSIHAVNGRPE